MATLFGISEQRAREALTTNCHEAVARGAARRLHQGVMRLSYAVSEPSPKQQRASGEKEWAMTQERGEAVKSAAGPTGKRKR